MQIRKMAVQDTLQVAELENKLFTRPWTRQGFVDTLQMENVCFLIAVEETQVLGYCGMYMAADEGEITNVAVDSNHRKNGIGRRLVEELLKNASEYGIKTYILEVRKSNIEAIQLYENLGFETQGIRKNFYELPQEDAYVMCLNQ